MKICPSDMKMCHPEIKKKPNPKPPPPEDKEPDIEWEPIPEPVTNLTKPGPKPGPGKPDKEGPPATTPKEKKKKKVKKVKKAKVKVQMKLKNVDYAKLTEEAKDGLKDKVAAIIAKKAGVPVSAVIIIITAGSVNIEADIDVSSKIEDNSDETKTEADLSAEAGDIDFSGLEAEVVAEAKEIDGIQEAATGEIEMEKPIVGEVEMEVEEVEIEVEEEDSSGTGGGTGTGEGTGGDASSAYETSLRVVFLALATRVAVNSL